MENYPTSDGCGGSDDHGWTLLVWEWVGERTALYLVPNTERELVTAAAATQGALVNGESPSPEATRAATLLGYATHDYEPARAAAEKGAREAGFRPDVVGSLVKYLVEPPVLPRGPITAVYSSGFVL